MILDTKRQTVAEEIRISERELQKLVTDNFDRLFPEYRLLETEFILQGDVRQFGVSGRIDILAFDPSGKRLVIFELKTTHSRNILIQALDYLDFLEIKGAGLFHRIQNLSRDEADCLLSDGNLPKIILIAENFTHPTLRRVERLKQPIKLFEYSVFENGLLQIKPVADNDKVDTLINPHTTPNVNPKLNEAAVIVKDLLGLGLVDSNFYKIESGAITFNPTMVYKSYVEYSLSISEVPASKTEFFNGIKKSELYLGNFSSVRFGKRRTSAMKIKL